MDYEHNKQAALAEWSNGLHADIIYYRGSIDRQCGADYITNLAPENNNVVLILCTTGGDPHAAYKIARALQAKYKKFYLYVNCYCKSAGTLIAIGSDEVIMGNGAELGPLDAQL